MPGDPGQGPELGGTRALARRGLLRTGGLAAGRHVSEPDAVGGLARLQRAHVHKVPIAPLIPNMWALRRNFSAYDAPYVALAAKNAVTLVTGDTRLVRAALAHCRVEAV